MKKKILLFLNKHPGIFNLAEILYSLSHRLKYIFQGTKSDEKYWEVRHLHKNESKKDDWGNKNIDWIKGYQDSTEHAHRQFLTEKISNLNPSSVLEIGCNCGPNLYLLSKKFPLADITGIDINPMAVQNGNKWFKQEGIKNVKLIVCKADELEQFGNESFDVVFTDAVLIYLGADKIKKVISEMLRITRNSLILLEWNDFYNEKNPLGKLKKHWIRNYKSLLSQFVSADKIKIEKLAENLWPDKNWQKYGALIEVHNPEK